MTARLCLPLVTLAVGCWGSDEALIDNLDCDYEGQPLGWDELGPAGVSARALLEPHVGTYTASGQYEDGGGVGITLAIAEGAEAPFARVVTGGDDAALCGDTLEIPVRGGFTTDDGAFAEAFDAQWSLSAEDAEGETLSTGTSWRPDGLSGSFEVTGLEAGEEAVSIVLSASVGSDGQSGSVFAGVEGEDEDTAWERDAPQLAWSVSP